ncbi:MAG TPA: hypothetical protein VM695_09880 [Phycisphaerae bacterium]|nr:hypothetical protein [Phycisphaerae bacterium]
MVIVAGLMVSLLAGCGGSKVTKGNFDQIKNGMTVAEVEGVLGKGVEQAGGGVSVGGVDLSGKSMVWKDGTKKIVVTFANGKVMAKVQEGL